MITLEAYHNDPKIKEKYLIRVRDHIAADELIHGKYWENGKGCAVGCTIHSSQHSTYETELGIPVMLARLEDSIFEGGTNGWSKEWPEKFLDAIPVGADLSKVGWKFLHWLLLDKKYGTIRYTAKKDRKIVLKIGGMMWDLALGKQINQARAAEAVWAAWAARAARAAGAAEAAGAAQRQGEKLIELLKEAPCGR